MPKLHVGYAGHLSDRVAALHSGVVSPEGIDLHFMPFSPSEAFRRMLRGEFDVGEMSLATHITAVAAGTSTAVAIPAFPSRTFRHSAIYVVEGRDVQHPTDLVGRRVGVPEYQMTAALWVRGLLKDEYGVDAAQIDWVTGGLRDAGRLPLIEVDIPGVRVTREIDRSLDELLVEGAIDAIVAPQAPPSFAQGRGTGRLFHDYRHDEADYYQRTGVFPIMHTVVLRREFHKAHPWAAVSLFDAFEQARRLAFESLLETEPLPVSLPWLQPELEHTFKIMGRDFWPYGIEENRHVLETACRYAHAQGLCSRLVNVEELFAPSVVGSRTARML